MDPSNSQVRVQRRWLMTNDSYSIALGTYFAQMVISYLQNLTGKDMQRIREKFLLKKVKRKKAVRESCILSPLYSFGLGVCIGIGLYLGFAVIRNNSDAIYAMLPLRYHYDYESLDYDFASPQRDPVFRYVFAHQPIEPIQQGLKKKLIKT